MNLLAGKVAIVTGASKGIGAGIANALSAEGASVVVTYASSRKGADRVLAEIADAGGNAIAVQAAVSDPEEVRRLFVETKKAFGKLDVLVNTPASSNSSPSRRSPSPSFIGNSQSMCSGRCSPFRRQFGSSGSRVAA